MLPCEMVGVPGAWNWGLARAASGPGVSPASLGLEGHMGPGWISLPRGLQGPGGPGGDCCTGDIWVRWGPGECIQAS